MFSCIHTNIHTYMYVYRKWSATEILLFYLNICSLWTIYSKTPHYQFDLLLLFLYRNHIWLDQALWFVTRANNGAYKMHSEIFNTVARILVLYNDTVFVLRSVWYDTHSDILAEILTPPLAFNVTVLISGSKAGLAKTWVLQPESICNWTLTAYIFS